VSDDDKEMVDVYI